MTSTRSVSELHDASRDPIFDRMTLMLHSNTSGAHALCAWWWPTSSDGPHLHRSELNVGLDSGQDSELDSELD